MLGLVLSPCANGAILLECLKRNMYKLAASVFSLALLVGVWASGSARIKTSGETMAMPRCASSDPVVDVNLKTNVYFTHSKSHMPNMRPMCKSKAYAIGARMAKVSMGKKKSVTIAAPVSIPAHSANKPAAKPTTDIVASNWKFTPAVITVHV